METFRADPFMTGPGGRRVLRSFSLSERDRRYARVRELMASEGLDAILAPGADGSEPQAPSRYLCQVGGVQAGAWVVFPASGEPVVVFNSERHMRMWTDNLSWPTETVWGEASDVVPERVKALGLEGARIGVAGMASVRRAEGVIPYETWSRFTKALPKASFVAAEEVLDRARVVKGAEEVSVLEAVTRANEDAIAKMMETARPGVEEAAVWVEMNDVLIRHTAEYPSRLSLGSNDRRGNTGNAAALPIVMEDGGIVSQEIAASLQGYQAQSNHSILVGLVGSANADAYREAMTAAVDVFEALVAWLKPGRTVGELLGEYARLGEEAGADVGGVMMHTNGLNGDRPRVGVGAAAHSQDWVIEPGWTFTIKTGLAMRSTGAYAQVGDPVTVEEGGARRLGRRKLEPFVTG